MRALFRNLPWSFWWFALTGAIYLLQLFPLTGIFLMFVAAPLWSIATVNLGFASLLVEVLTRRISVVWLVLPVAWFCGYPALAYFSQQQAAALDAKLRAENAAQRVRFDPAQHALLFDVRAHQLSNAASHLVQNYRLPVAYQKNFGGKDPTMAHRVVTDPLCHTVRSDKSFEAAYVRASPIYERDQGGSGRWARQQTVQGVCALSMPETLQLQPIEVQVTEERHKEFLLPRTLTRISIRDSSGAVTQLSVGRAEPLYWLPMPVMGCALNSGAARWECFVGFWRSTVAVGGSGVYGSEPGAVADALGLEQVFAADRRDEIAAAAIPSLDDILRAHIDQSLAALDGAIAVPGRSITVHDVRGLAQQPDVLGDRPARMVEAIGRALALGNRGYETARVMQGILAALPAPRFDALGPALLAMFGAQPNLGRETVEAAMAVRLARLGAPAIPLLERMVMAQPKRPYSAALYGFCRVGLDAAGLAERIAALTSTQEKGRRDEDTAIYAALMRMGRADIVEREQALGRFGNVDRRVVERNITSVSPPTVCTDGNGWPRVPE